MNAKRSPLVGMDFDEAIARLAQTKPEEVKPPKGRKRKKAKPKRVAGVTRAPPATPEHTG
jgi:hypothetical protein